jgi:hypothetical protein
MERLSASNTPTSTHIVRLLESSSVNLRHVGYRLRRVSRFVRQHPGKRDSGKEQCSSELTLTV